MLLKITPIPDMLSTSNPLKEQVSHKTFTDTHTIRIHLGTLEISMTNDADPALVAETLKRKRCITGTGINDGRLAAADHFFL